MSIQSDHNLILRLFIVGILMYGSGFLLWNLGDFKNTKTYLIKSKAKFSFLSSSLSENEFCQHVEAVRSFLPPLLAPITQLHGWWHLCAGELLIPAQSTAHFLAYHFSIICSLSCCSPYSLSYSPPCTLSCSPPCPLSCSPPAYFPADQLSLYSLSCTPVY